MYTRKVDSLPPVLPIFLREYRFREAIMSFLVLVRTIKRNKGMAAVCRCVCGKEVVIGMWRFKSGHAKTCGSKECTSQYLSGVRTGEPRPDMVGKTPANKIDRTGQRYGRLVALKDEGNGRWLCQCDCGRESSVLSINLALYAKKNIGCNACKIEKSRADIAGERRGLVVAACMKVGTMKPPIWIFRCDCGGQIEGSVMEFHQNWIRSCGCIGNTYNSWQNMISRCYNPKSIRYYCYGERGITVCERWRGKSGFENFLYDMGERPLNYTLSRKDAEGHYVPENCFWELGIKNRADTCNGVPTKPGILKGAKPRNRHK